MATADRPLLELRVDEDPALVPDCPHCSSALESISTRSLTASGRPSSRFGRRFVYACPNCNKLLGVSHRKGFWMG